MILKCSSEHFCSVLFSWTINRMIFRMTTFSASQNFRAVYSHCPHSVIALVNTTDAPNSLLKGKLRVRNLEDSENKRTSGEKCSVAWRQVLHSRLSLVQSFSLKTQQLCLSVVWNPKELRALQIRISILYSNKPNPNICPKGFDKGIFTCISWKVAERKLYSRKQQNILKNTAPTLNLTLQYSKCF